jgi:hypothetical protein
MLVRVARAPVDMLGCCVPACRDSREDVVLVREKDRRRDDHEHQTRQAVYDWGVDGDSEVVAHLFDERHEAVKTLVANMIGICGQAPSDCPEFARLFVEQGIDGISLNPDAVVRTTLEVLETEKALAVMAQRGAGLERSDVDSSRGRD